MKVRAERVSVDVVCEWLAYEPDTGILRWRKGKQKIRVGDEAGYVAVGGHRVLKIEGQKYFAHRVAWAIHHGNWPPDDHDVDHINGNRDDNSAANMRLATRSQNLANIKRNSKNTSGVKGVCWNKRERKWMAQIRAGGKRLNLGCYRELSDAAEAYQVAALRLHGQFANLGD